MPALHLPAIAHECGIEFDLHDVAEIFRDTPYIADLKPGGRYVTKDLGEAGGVPLLMKALLDGGYLHGDCITVTGRTIAENLADVVFADRPGRGPSDQQPDHHRPAASSGLRGTLAPEGAIVKVAGLKNLQFSGPARVFECEEDAFAAVERRDYKEGEVLVIRYEGPQGRPRHARDAVDHLGALRPGHGRQGGADHRRPLLRRHARLLHRPCRPGGGGRRADRRCSKDGDIIAIDAEAGTLDVELGDDELAARRKGWTPRQHDYQSGALWKYAQTVGRGREGCGDPSRRRGRDALLRRHLIVTVCQQSPGAGTGYPHYVFRPVEAGGGRLSAPATCWPWC